MSSETNQETLKENRMADKLQDQRPPSIPRARSPDISSLPP